MKTVIKVTCVDQTLQLTATPVIACGGSEDVRVEFSFCPLWQGYPRTAMFWRTHKEVHTRQLDAADSCLIPAEVLQTDGALYFAVFGVNAEGVRRTSEALAYPIGVGAITEGTKPPEPAPDLYTQVLAAVAMAQPPTPSLPVADDIADADSVPMYSVSAVQHRRITWGSIVAKLRVRLFGDAKGVLQADGSGGISAKAVDSTPTANSDNLVTSGGVQAAMANTQPSTSSLSTTSDIADADSVPVYSASAKQNKRITWSSLVAKLRATLFGTTNGVLQADGSGGISAKAVDTTPTKDSANLVTSGGVQAALAATVKAVDSTPTKDSTNLVTSGGVQAALSDLWSYGEEDLVDGESPLEEGKLYFVI